jgi:GT2 family glycosyltransferase
LPPNSEKPRLSIVIAGHNEGENLLKTVESCLETASDLDPEVVVADDASNDGSLEALLRRHPEVKTVSHAKRRGTSPTKDLGARGSTGDTLVFLDAHCKPEPWAIEILLNDVEDFAEGAVFTPRIPALDCERWESNRTQMGFGYAMTLDGFQCNWLGLDAMSRRGRFYESPGLVGCCFAVSRALYEELGGFDPAMIEWGVEDIDFALRAWLLGHAVLHDPFAEIGHRFRVRFDTFTVSTEAVLVNQVRMARKCFIEDNWTQWLEKMRAQHAPDLWERVWALFEEGRESVERDRESLMRRRPRDEAWFAEKFGLDWPARR